MSRMQLKIMGALALLVALVVGATGVLAERGLRERALDSIRTSLERQTRLVVQLVETTAFDEANSKALQAIADRSAASSGARVTFIAPAGRVLADSEVPESGVAALSNHADRPEIIAAVARGVGISIRHSATLKRKLFYYAVYVRGDESNRGIAADVTQAKGIVRLALNLDQIDAASAQLRRELIIAGLLGLLGALGLSAVLSAFSLRPIRELREVVSDVASGQLDRRLRWDTRDERGDIAASINQMSLQMRNTMEDALRGKAQLEAVLASMVEGVLVIDRDRKLILINPRGREMLSVWTDYEGRAVPEVIRSAEVDAAIQDAASRNEVVVREIEIYAEKTRMLLMHASRFPDTEPRSGTVVVFHDVTELRRVDDVRRDFIANASHELRTPLTSIGGFADTLAQGDLSPEDQAKYLDVIVRNVKRMSDLVDDLLILSRIESGSSQLELGEVDVARIAETVILDFEPRFEEAELTVKLEVKGKAICVADRGALEQILTNLVGNAARYSNPGSRVDITIEPKGAMLEVVVADTGIGIPEDDLERIFERFYRVDAARSRVLGSTGLGLSIVKHLVSAQGGEIHVESRLNIGSKFAFTLPTPRH
ncbi:MAG: ATP-binding protein [bacterium]|jgi:two-component system phosphate regulon sensor histidine kinase PhoR